MVLLNKKFTSFVFTAAGWRNLTEGVTAFDDVFIIIDK